MASKVSPFLFCKRTPILLSQSLRLHSTSSAARAQFDQISPQKLSLFDSSGRSLKNKLHPDRLIQALDSTPDLILAADIFRWASRQQNFRQTAHTYAHLILKLGIAGIHNEMETFLKEMFKFEFPDTKLAVVFLIESFCRENCRIREALKVFEFAVSAKCRLSVSTCNCLLRALVLESKDFESVIFVYKEMVKAGILPVVETLNHLIMALCKTGRVDFALNQFRRMKMKHCDPNSWTFEILISELCSSGRVEEGVEVWNQMLESGISPHRGFYTRIMPLFCSVGKTEEVIELFKLLKAAGFSPDVHVYSVLIQCLCENLQVDDAVELFEEMGELGLFPSTSMYVDILNGYCKSGNFDAAMSFLEESDTPVVEPYNALVNEFCEAERFTEAINYVKKMEGRGISNGLSWNILIRWLCKRGDVSRAFQILGRMIASSFLPDQETYSSILTGYCRMGAKESALDWFWQHFFRDMTFDSESCSELIEGACHVKKVQEAAEVLYCIISKGYAPNSVSLNILIQSLCQVGRVNEAIKLCSLALGNGTSCTPFTYNSIVLGLLKLNKGKDILLLLSQMLVGGCGLDLTNYCILIRALCIQRTNREATLLFNQMVHDGLIPDPETVEKLIPNLTRCSRLHVVVHSLDKVIKEQGLSSPAICNMVISGLLKEGYKHEACRFLDWMLDHGWVPDADTHGLLVGNIGSEQRDGEIQARENGDRVGNILVEGLGNSNRLMVEG